jgi:hypothetical protein
VVDDVKSNVEEDGELKLREAVLEFRGSKKEDSEGVGVEGVVVVVARGRVSAVSRLESWGSLEGSHGGDCLVWFLL